MAGAGAGRRGQLPGRSTACVGRRRPAGRATACAGAVVVLGGQGALDRRAVVGTHLPGRRADGSSRPAPQRAHLCRLAGLAAGRFHGGHSHDAGGRGTRPGRGRPAHHSPHAGAPGQSPVGARRPGRRRRCAGTGPGCSATNRPPSPLYPGRLLHLGEVPLRSESTPGRGRCSSRAWPSAERRVTRSISSGAQVPWRRRCWGRRTTPQPGRFSPEMLGAQAHAAHRRVNVLALVGLAAVMGGGPIASAEAAGKLPDLGRRRSGPRRRRPLPAPRPSAPARNS